MSATAKKRGKNRDADERKFEVIRGIADGKGRRKSWSQLLRPGPDFRLSSLDPGSTPGFAKGKSAGVAQLADRVGLLGTLQEQLSADAKTGGSTAALVLVIQGMDTAGKGGIVRHVVGAMDPEGVKATAFKAPTPVEKAHPFLWRIEQALPGPGKVGVFDRSHYEDVLVVRVHDLVPKDVWQARYDEINAWEQGVVESGTQLVKVMLHISRDEQKARLLGRLDNPEKYYKYNPGDVDERERWDDYMAAYQDAVTRCSTDAAPWHVIPADRKWYARLAVQELLLEKLAGMGLDWPAATFDVATEKARVLAS